MGFTAGGMSGYPPPGPPGMMVNPQLGAGAVPRPNMPGAGSKHVVIVIYLRTSDVVLM